MNDKPHGDTRQPIQSMEQIVERYAVSLDVILCQVGFQVADANLRHIVVPDDSISFGPTRERGIFRSPPGGFCLA
jgi:hypothetical protein